MTQMWAQREGESSKAYRAFWLYVWLDKERSILAAYRQYSGKESARLAPGYFNAWSSEHDWPARAKAYDLHVLEEREAGYELARRQAQAEMSRRSLEVVTKAVQIATGELEAKPQQVTMIKDLLDRLGVGEAGPSEAALLGAEALAGLLGIVGWTPGTKEVADDAPPEHGQDADEEVDLGGFDPSEFG